jgi:hypothetical protein
VSVGVAAFAVLAVAGVGRALGAGAVAAYPHFSMQAGAAEVTLCAVTLLAAAMPFLAPGARAGVARA